MEKMCTLTQKNAAGQPSSRLDWMIYSNYRALGRHNSLGAGFDARGAPHPAGGTFLKSRSKWQFGQVEIHMRCFL
jgi:hypothetical protein